MYHLIVSNTLSETIIWQWGNYPNVDSTIGFNNRFNNNYCWINIKDAIAWSTMMSDVAPQDERSGTHNQVVSCIQLQNPK